MPENFENKNEEERLPLDQKAEDEIFKSQVEGYKKAMEELAIEKGVDFKTLAEGFAAGRLRSINIELSYKHGFDFKSDQLPKIIFGKYEGNFHCSLPRQMESGQVKKVHIICLENMEAILDGTTLPEELAHFYRESLRPKDDKEEEITDEFFGFIGQRLFYKILKEGNSSLDYTREKGPEDWAEKKKEIVKLIRGINKEVGKGVISRKKNYEDLSREIIDKGLNDGELKTEIQEAINSEDKLFREKKQELRDLVTHQRGYEHASRIDLDKIHDWKKIFSMSNKDVRKRFFTATPDYSDL